MLTRHWVSCEGDAFALDEVLFHTLLICVFYPCWTPSPWQEVVTSLLNNVCRSHQASGPLLGATDWCGTVLQRGSTDTSQASRWSFCSMKAVKRVASGATSSGRPPPANRRRKQVVFPRFPHHPETDLCSVVPIEWESADVWTTVAPASQN